MLLQDEKLLAGVLHDILAKMMYQIRNVRRVAILVLGRQSEGVAALVREEHLKASSVEHS